MLEVNNSLQYDELAQAYPKATEKLVAWVMGNLQNFQTLAMRQAGVGEEVVVKEVTRDQAKMATGAMLNIYFRTLYDFFDINEVFVDVLKLEEKEWGVDINNKYCSGDHKRRIDAELVGFKEAFKVLEEKL